MPEDLEVPVLPFLLIFGVIVWRLWREYRRISSLADFTEQEKAALTRQVIATFIGMPFLLALIVSVVTGGGSLPGLFTVYLVVGFAILSYVAASALRHRALISGAGGMPIKGTSAVGGGVVIIALEIFIGLLLLLNWLK